MTRLLALALAALLVPAAPAFADDATASERQRVVAHLTSLGYSQIQDVDVEDGVFEADARAPDGRDVDVLLDRTTLAILRITQS